MFVKKHVVIGAVIVFLGVGSKVYADDASKQIQMLNSQLQVQFQRIQDTQNTQIQKLNDQFQKQLKEVQEKLQAQIQAEHHMTQEKLKTIQSTLDAKIDKVHEELLTGGLTSSSTNQKKSNAKASQPETDTTPEKPSPQ